MVGPLGAVSDFKTRFENRDAAQRQLAATFDPESGPLVFGLYQLQACSDRAFPSRPNVPSVEGVENGFVPDSKESNLCIVRCALVSNG